VLKVESGISKRRYSGPYTPSRLCRPAILSTERRPEPVSYNNEGNDDFWVAYTHFIHHTRKVTLSGPQLFTSMCEQPIQLCVLAPQVLPALRKFAMLVLQRCKLLPNIFHSCSPILQAPLNVLDPAFHFRDILICLCHIILSRFECRRASPLVCLHTRNLLLQVRVAIRLCPEAVDAALLGKECIKLSTSLLHFSFFCSFFCAGMLPERNQIAKFAFLTPNSLLHRCKLLLEHAIVALSCRTDIGDNTLEFCTSTNEFIELGLCILP
jgi:hypothetical protein